jgi:hypothetical protein
MGNEWIPARPVVGFNADGSLITVDSWKGRDAMGEKLTNAIQRLADEEIESLRAENARLRLTPEERAAIEAALGWCDDRDAKTITTLRSLLERLG